MEETTALWKIMEIIRQLSFGDKVRLLEELNSEIEYELDSAKYSATEPPGKSRKNRVADTSKFDTQHDRRPTFTYDDLN